MAKPVVTLITATLLAFGLVSSESWGQFKAAELQQLRNSRPGARAFLSGEDIAAIYGTELATGATPLDSARNYLARWQGIYARNVGELLSVANSEGRSMWGVMEDRLTGQPRFHTFRFDQHHKGIPVFRKGIGFLTRNEPGHPLVLSGFDVAELEGVQLDIPAEAPRVSADMEKSVLLFLEGESGPSPLLHDWSDERYVIWAGLERESTTPRLAVSFVITRGSVETVPDYVRYSVVAAADTGEVLLAENLIHNVSTHPLVDVNGTVRGNATNGVRSADCDPEVSLPLPWAEVNVVGGNTAFAGADGSFTIPHGGSASVSVRSRLRGQWFEVRDQAAANSVPELTLVLTPPGPANFLHNPSGTEFSTANVNTYLEANRIRDWVLSFEPSYPVIGTQTFFSCNTNINASCNAFYDGVSINFYWSADGCMNTSMSDVIYHEYGHHLIAVTGNGQGQLGEGSGDVVGVLLQDEPILAAGWNVGVCNTGIRNANNFHQYPCTGAIHDCGQLISGCVWSTRNELIVTEPANYREINAALFLGMLIVRGQQLPGNSTIDPFITILYLTLDDDDSDIGNGTPHYDEIATGFGAHNMDAPPLDLLQFDYPNGRPEKVHPLGQVEFTVAVSGVIGTPVSGSGVLHVDRGNGFEAFPMTEIASNLYEAEFPATTCGIGVRYYISVATMAGPTDTDPEQAPGAYFTARSAAKLTTNWADDFETNTGWSVSGNATFGHWQRGIPVGGGIRGDPAMDGDGSGRCYLTENAAGNTDVDDGSTILTSPILDASGLGDKVLSYSRWYSNHFGNAPFQDTFVVEISNNGGSSWTLLESVGPGGPEVSGGWLQKSFLISDYLTPTNQMRLRFTASDLLTGSVVEAGVDGVEIETVQCGKTTVRPFSGPIGSGGTRSL